MTAETYNFIKKVIAFIVKKLTSRKLWVAFTGLVSGIMIYRGASENQAAQVSALILQAASVIAYCVGEGLADSTH